MPLELRDDPRPGGIVLPRYDGHSILNVPASVCAALGVPPPTNASPLDPSVLPPAMLERVTAIVLLVVDGLGWDLLQSSVYGRGSQPFVYGDEYGDQTTVGDLASMPWLQAARRADPSVGGGPRTSVFPSPTTPALA